jgi:hypothetical protein
VGRKNAGTNAGMAALKGYATVARNSKISASSAIVF